MSDSSFTAVGFAWRGWVDKGGTPFLARSMDPWACAWAQPDPGEVNRRLDELLETPSQTLPVVIGEFGPSQMSLDECGELTNRAEALEIPYLAWTFHGRCPPNLIEDYNGCGVGAALVPTEWGSVLKGRLAQPWAPYSVRFHEKRGRWCFRGTMY